MNAIIMGLIGVIWANIALVSVILGFFGGDILAALVLLFFVFATPFVMDKIADIV